MLLHTSSPVEKCINQERESGSQRRAAAHHFPAKLSPSKNRGKRIELGWEVVCSRSALGSRLPFPVYTFLYRTGRVKEHSEPLPQCPDARISTSIQSQPIIDIHRSHTAVSDAKYCISGDMANVMIDGASELEMGKNNNLPFG